MKHDGSAARRQELWCAEQYAGLITDLSLTLDLEAGASEATQAGHFSALAADLSGLLDIAAGQRASGAVTEPGGCRPVSSLTVRTGDHTWVERFALDLVMIGAPARLDLRLNPHYLEIRDTIHRTADLDLVGDLDRALARTHDLFQESEEAQSRALSVARVARDRNYAADYRSSVSRAIDFALVCVRRLMDALDAPCQLALDLVERLARDLDIVRDVLHVSSEPVAYSYNHGLTLAHDLTLSVELALTGVRDRAEKRRNELHNVREQIHAVDPARGLARNHYDVTKDVAYSHRLLGDLSGALAASLQNSPDLRAARAAALAIGRHLDIARASNTTEQQWIQDIVEQAVTDFTGADLSSAALESASLERVRWSASTRWPLEWAAHIRDVSIEVQPGIFEIRSGRQASPHAALRGT